MHQRERARDEAVAQSREPPLAIVGHRVDIAAHRLDEDQLRQFGQTVALPAFAEAASSVANRSDDSSHDALDPRMPTLNSPAARKAKDS